MTATIRKWRIAFFALVLALAVPRTFFHPLVLESGAWRAAFLLTWVACLGAYVAVFPRRSTGAWPSFDGVAVTGLTVIILFEALWPEGRPMLRPAQVAAVIAGVCLGAVIGYRGERPGIDPTKDSPDARVP